MLPDCIFASCISNLNQLKMKLQFLLLTGILFFAFANICRATNCKTVLYASPTIVMSPDSIELFDIAGNLINNKTVQAPGINPDADALTFYIHVKNNTSNTLKLYARRLINQQVEETANWFCFGKTCYGPMTDSSLSAITINAGEIDKSFYGDYAPSGKGGLTSITYEFYDKETFGKRIIARTTVEFAVSATGLNRDESRLVISPNPVSNNAVFQYKNEFAGVKKLIICDTHGRKIDEIPLNRATAEVTLDFSSYPAGIYFANLASGTRIIATKKIVVTR